MKSLDGVKVITLEHATAAPFRTRQLADPGARVIKIERPGVGDFARAYDERVHGMASHFVWCNRSKESLTLDVKGRQAQGIFERLLEDTDVLVQHLAPGAAARLGLSYEALHEKYPRRRVRAPLTRRSTRMAPSPPAMQRRSCWDCKTSVNGVSCARRFYWSLNSPSIPASVPTRNAWQHARNCEKSSSPHSAMLTSEELISRLDTAQIANARMNDMPDVWSHPQLRERNRWVSVDSPAGVIPALLPPGISTASDVRLDAVPARPAHRGPFE
jgi:crotonobetainyl-CoA:carnitine CoA-transferase CaiB-like acyl-CoA transferase